MNLFFKKLIFLFLSITFIISFTAFIKVKFLGFEIATLFTKDERFVKILFEFENFKKERDNINLILGSSLANSMNAKQLGKNWFNFSNPYQQIYNSYRFVENHSKTIVIDSIFISIQNSDFLPRTHYEKIDWAKKSSSLRMNNNFYIFEEIFVNVRLKVNSFFNNLKLTSSDLNRLFNKKKKNQNTHDFYHNKSKPKNLDSIYVINKQLNNRHNQYFSFLNENIDTYYIEEFQSMCDRLGIKVFFISTPKSKYYHYNLIDNDYKDKNIAIKNKLKSLPIKFYDYEHLTVEINEKAFYIDETHMASNGAQFFTNRIILDFLKN